MSKIYTSADRLIGNTPILELTHIEMKARLLARLEYFNPAGLVKDRIAKSMVDEAERSGKLTPSLPASGNTGIGLGSGDEGL